MNDLFVMLGIEDWKPTLSAFIMPPLPFLLLVLVGGRLMFRRRLLAWGLLLFSVAGIWLTCTPALATLLSNALLQPPRALPSRSSGTR